MRHTSVAKLNQVKCKIIIKSSFPQNAYQTHLQMKLAKAKKDNCNNNPRKYRAHGRCLIV